MKESKIQMDIPVAWMNKKQWNGNHGVKKGADVEKKEDDDSTRQRQLECRMEDAY